MREYIREALETAHRTGNPEAFLDFVNSQPYRRGKQDFAKARTYSVVWRGAEYPSKAILSYAYQLRYSQTGVPADGHKPGWDTTRSGIANFLHQNGARITGLEPPLRELLPDTDAQHARQFYEELADRGREFDPDDIPDERVRQLAEVVRRRGQSKFRRELLSAYEGRCAVTDCDAIDALDAAHISPYRGPKSNNSQNGLLLRSDIHNLFDLGLIAVDVQNMTLVLSSKIKGTHYGKLHGQMLRIPADNRKRPSAGALAAHRTWAKI